MGVSWGVWRSVSEYYENGDKNVTARGEERSGGEVLENWAN